MTPIIKCTHSTRKDDIVTFFTIGDFKSWADSRNDMKKWNVKYYKGLGTSDNKEAVEYFTHMQKHQIKFRYDGEDDSKSIDLLFNKNRADDRKEWLTTYNPEVGVDHNIKVLSYRDFVHQEFIHFSVADNMRSIPSIMDGFKVNKLASHL